MKRIDCTGLGCPIPVINTKKYFDSIEDGIAEVVVDNEVSKNNVEKFAKNSGYNVKVEEVDKKYILMIEKLLNNDKKEDTDESFIVVISSDKFGEGHDELGKTLMKSYLYALSEDNKVPNSVIFLNGGVKLTINESAALDSLRLLEEKGVEIFSCGTCLDFYGIQEKLAIGEITNMYSIVNMMNESKKVIKL